MEIKVNPDVIVSLIEAIKQLPVKGDFNVADRWVGIVLTLEQLLQTEETAEE